MATKLEFKGLDKVVKDLKEMQRQVRTNEVLYEFAEEVRNEMVSRIEGQRFKHAPLSPWWAALKRARGLDPRILIATQGYVKSIFAARRKKGAAVGIPHKYVKIADGLENGRSNMPARPHWAPIQTWAVTQWPSVVQRFGERLLK